jgi:hypothetical protein
MTELELNNLKILIHNRDTVQLGLELSRELDDQVFNELILEYNFTKLNYYYRVNLYGYLDIQMMISTLSDGKYIYINDTSYLSCFRFYMNKTTQFELREYLEYLIKMSLDERTQT